MNYYYLVSSLPGLVLGQPPPWSVEKWVERNAPLMTRSDAQELRLVAAGRAGEGTTAFSRRWSAVEAQLDNALARERARRHGREGEGGIRRTHEGWSVAVERAVADAWAKPNPLERELALDRLRWQLAEEGARAEPFGLPAVLAYVIHLRLAVRWAGLNEAAGRARISEVEEELTGRIA